ncbi:helix-turn-helix domain-containing protein [Niallia nealsonii]|uniref:Transcriptional regulator n=1 Tax=Niallia nealsonii TaxID=115979 RepID=A0A2N0Z4C4_9BACI|nr:helix-turn-helix transcriptional regulator [Niallia nealsonii]PKG24365.1 transcriptional regulator [Niallia nealsonii]
MSDFLKIVGDSVRIYRKAKGLTQEELAEQAGLQSTYIGGVERGERNISLDTLDKILRGLDISAYQLFKTNKSTVDLKELDKKRKIEVINDLLIDRDEKEIVLVYELIKDIVKIVDKDTK